MNQLNLSFEFSGFDQSTWTVSQLTAYIRELFDIDYRLQEIGVIGEISNFSRARSGHLYFTLKDEGAQIKCVMWRTAADKLRFQPQEGDAVAASGKVSVYEAAGAYQLYVNRIEPIGRGDLALAYEQLKQKLADEGLFEESNKIPLPRYPRKIGIVTSSDAAALRDILNVFNRRWPLIRVLIAPALVQGKEAPSQLIKALEFLDSRDDIDVIIIARGGGSIEDLWAFNDELLARSIFAAEKPIVVGVGHETDFTIVDFVADVRAPTPSAAAELAVPDLEELTSIIQGLSMTAEAVINNKLKIKRSELEAFARALRHLSPAAAYDRWRQQLDWLAGRIDRAMESYFDHLDSRLTGITGRLTSVAPQATLARGYAIVRDPVGKVIVSVADVFPGDSLAVRVRDGEFDVTVD